ncbi:MAG: PEP-CTERM sorting domain-containing protein [Akkermansiaceae bacterium]
MKPTPLAVLPLLLTNSASGFVLFSDNFDTADTANFDAAPTTGRLSGTLASDVVLRSFGFQQDISGNQLLMPNGAGGGHGVRFENAAGPFGGGNRFDWAAGATGTAILNAGGFSVTFDVTPAGNTTPDWISFQVGTVNADSGNLTNDDYGILFRQNGATERFDNGTNLGAGGSFPATLASRSVEIQYAFSSFADGSNVTATSFVDGVQVASDVFQWDGNGGEMRMELGHNDPGLLVDNLTVSTLDVIPEPSSALLSSLALFGLLARRRR